MVRGQTCPGWAPEGEEEGKRNINFCCQYRFLQLGLWSLAKRKNKVTFRKFIFHSRGSESVGLGRKYLYYLLAPPHHEWIGPFLKYSVRASYWDVIAQLSCGGHGWADTCDKTDPRTFSLVEQMWPEWWKWKGARPPLLNNWHKIDLLISQPRVHRQMKPCERSNRRPTKIKTPPCAEGRSSPRGLQGGRNLVAGWLGGDGFDVRVLINSLYLWDSLLIFRSR